MEHVHVSAVDFVIWAAYFMIFKLFVNVYLAKFPETAIGKALAVLG